MAEEEVDYSQLPLPDRFQHKNWKVRKEGYEAAVKAFEITPDESDPVFRPFNSDSGLWKAAAGDSNVAAQQEGLAALCAFLRYGGSQGAQRSRTHALQPIYEKGLTSTRPAAKANAYEALLLYIEVDKPDAVIEELLPALSHKQPKVTAATLNALTQIYHNFGIKVVDPKIVLKVLPKIYGHADKNVRAEGQNLTVELYRWLKEAMKPMFWADLKPVQQTDLEKLFEKVKEEPAPKQERFTRAQQAQMATAQAHVATAGPEEYDEVAGDDAYEEEPADIDAFDLAEPVDACSKIPATFNDNIASSKWKDRKDALDELLAILNTPRLKQGPYDEVVRAFAKSMKDANIAVVTVAANCVEKLAQGLRKEFSRYRSSIMNPMMERLKEKKQSVTDALGAAMDAVFIATSLTDNMADIMPMLVHKNPNVKVETLKFLVRCLRTTREVPTKDEQKQIADAGNKLLTESTEAMRSGGAEILGTLMKIIGERAFGPHLDGLDDPKKTKIKEYFESAEVKAKEKPKPVAAPPKAVAGPPAGKRAIGAVKKAPIKKLAAAPAPAEDATPLPPKPSARPVAKPVGLAKPGLAQPSGLKLGGLKKPTATGIASPQRRVMSPISNVSEDEPAIPSPSKFAPGRGLTARSLAKPATTPASPPPPQFVSNALSNAERGELEELRLERERLLSLTETLRGQNAKLSGEISELQNQNAQLIEDHTRDVLQIKAKETQLVRARGECDVLRTEVETVKRDSDRYRREVSRLGRESIGRDREDLIRGRQHFDDFGTESYDEAPRQNPNTAHLNGNGRPGSTILQRTGSTASNGSSRPAVQRPQSNLAFSPTDEKENLDAETSTRAVMRRKISPPVSQSSGRSPQRPQFGVNREQSSNNANSNGPSNGPGGEGGENWKRAAEVTSQLKARIEAMKARQGLTKPSY